MDKEQKDRYDAVKGLAAGWISSADGKATGLLTIAAVVLGAVAFFPVSGVAQKLSYAGKIALLVTAVLSILSVAASCLVLLPRLNREGILKGRGQSGQPLARSITFFSDLAGLSLAEFKKSVAEPKEADIDKDIEEQTYVLAVTARDKMCWMRCSVGLLMASFVSIAALAVISLSGW